MESPVPSSELPLVVDVDGTLLRTDLLGEGALSALFSAPLSVLSWPWQLMRGKAALKQAIATKSEIALDVVPLNDDVVEFLEREKARGRKLYVASASDRSWIEGLAARLGFFDGIFASDGKTNLAGKAKADKLVEAFGHRGFDYIGNGRADLPVWAVAHKALLADVPERVAVQARRGNPDVEVVSERRAGSLSAVVRALRPHQWIKNLLVFLPLLAAQHFDLAGFAASLVAFVAMSFCASSGYVINDLADLTGDRRHPRKRARPFASGALSPTWGMAMAVVPLLAGLLVAAALSWQVAAMVAGYYVVSLTYSFVLKRKLMLDVFALAFLYTFRIGVGAVATATVVSEWLLAFSMFFFLSLAIVKRCNELARHADRSAERVSDRGYHAGDADIVGALAVAAGFCSVLVLALYINTPTAAALYERPQLLWGACFLLAYWLGRVFILARRGHMPDDPILFAFRDKASIVAGLGVVAVALAAS
ncbi:MAG TPA: UbiA family prenyltransferase [Alphaproteobacteria bacterium]|jgi:4-hydroxybenzoate polyprenyltransferase